MTIEDAGDGHMFEAPSGEKVFVQCLGGVGPPAVFCHATGFHGSAYRPMAAELFSDFTVWAIDIPGHGRSPRPSSGYFSWSVMAKDVRAAINELTSEPVFGFGHSMGGSMLLLSELAQPGLLRAAYLFEPIVFPAEFLIGAGENPMSGAARKRRRKFPSRSDAAWHYSRRPPLNQLRSDVMHAYVEHGFVDLPDGSVLLACDPEDEATTFECEEKVTMDLISGMTLPTVVAAGRPGPEPSPARLAEIIAESIEGGSLVVYQDMGHLGPLELPDHVGSAVRSFFLQN